jgi:two-component system capsular synthesis sensor histidine kinase RcsC
MRLLLADDNEMNVDLFTAALDQHDITVERDGAAALQRALGERFDLILLDVQMPRMRGDEVCRELRARGISTPIVALSAAAMQDDMARTRSAGFDAYLTKPISPESLRAAVRQHARPAA